MADAIRRATDARSSRTQDHDRPHTPQRFHGRQQQRIGPVIVDFYCDEAGLVVEVDGPVNAEQEETDQSRDELLAELGLRVLRIAAQDVEDDMAAALRDIEAALVN